MSNSPDAAIFASCLHTLQNISRPPSFDFSMLSNWTLHSPENSVAYLNCLSAGWSLASIVGALVCNNVWNWALTELASYTQRKWIGYWTQCCCDDTLQLASILWNKLWASQGQLRALSKPFEFFHSKPGRQCVHGARFVYMGIVVLEMLGPLSSSEGKL